MKKKIIVFIGLLLLMEGCTNDNSIFSKNIPNNKLSTEYHGDITLYLDEKNLLIGDPVFNLKYKDIYIFNIIGIPPMFFENDNYIIVSSGIRKKGERYNRKNQFKFNIIDKKNHKLIISKIFKSPYIFDPSKDRFSFKKNILYIEDINTYKNTIQVLEFNMEK